MALAPTAVLALLAAAAGHFESPEPARRLSTASSMGHIWGGHGARCNQRLSAGPADADLEIRLGGLRASTAQEDVHLQWWSPRKSATLYNPEVSPIDCSVHSSVLTAYPRFDDAEFNGGNVRVSESGEAVIRVRAPSSYFAWRWVATPHIHLRLCTGARSIHQPSAAVMLRGQSPWISQGHGSNVRILSFGTYAGRNGPATAGNPEPRPLAIITGCGGCELESEEATTLPATTTVAIIATPAPTNTTATLAATAITATGTPTSTTATLTATTTASITSTRTPGATAVAQQSQQTATPEANITAAAMQSVHISVARDALDLEALEFSPVYGCLLEQKFFDHFASECAASCPPGSDMAHGQCVREETEDPQAELSVSWMLSVHCGDPCWHSKQNVTLHNVRLSVAGHLDIPFQEVEVSTGFALSSARRLTDAKTAQLTVTILSNRISASEGIELMGSYAQDASAMSTLLALNVGSVRAVAPAAEAALDEETVMGQGSDPYVPAYAAIEDVPGGGVVTSAGVLSFLPTEAVIGIAIGIVVLAGLFGAWLLRRRRRQRHAQAEEERVRKLGNKVAEAEDDATGPAKPACV